MEEEENNPMKALENRTVDSKREMEILDALQDIRARNARIERAGQSDELLARMHMQEVEDDEAAEEKRLEEEDEALVRAVFSKVALPPIAGPSTASTSTSTESTPTLVTLKRKATEAEPSLQTLLPDSARALIAAKAAAPPPTTKKPKTNKLGIKIVKKAKAVS